MRFEYSQAIDPIFFAVLDLVERIRSGQPVTASEERDTLLGKFREADEKLARRQEEWLLIKYALIAWIDDVLIFEIEWVEKEWWDNNAIAFEVFKTTDRATKFFKKAKEAARLTRGDTVEVFHICVALGFRGFYRNPDPQQVAFIAESLDLPSTLDAWANKIAGAIRWGYGRPPFDNRRRDRRYNEPLDGRTRLERYAILGGILAALSAGLAWAVGARM